MADAIADGPDHRHRTSIFDEKLKQGNIEMKRAMWLLFFSAFTIFVFCSACSAQTTSGVIEGKNDWLFPGWDSLKDRKPDGEKKSAELIGSINKELSSRNIKLIVILIPTKFTYYRQYLPDGLSVSPAVDRRYDFILASLKDVSVQTVDVRDAFRKLLDQNQLVFYRTDYHWTSVCCRSDGGSSRGRNNERWNTCGRSRIGNEARRMDE